MKFLLTTSLLLITILGFNQTVDVTVETPATITRCGAEQVICVTIENNTADTLLSVTGKFILPYGADVQDYESKPPGSISLMGDILDIPNLLPGESYEFSVSFGVNCNTPEGAGTIIYTIDYTRMSDMMMDNASGITSSFQIQSADLSTPTSIPSPVEVYKGYTFTVNTLVANGGNGALDEFLYCVSNDNLNVILTGISVGGIPLMLHSSGAGFDCYYAPPIISNGSLTVDEEWEVVDCQKPSLPILRRAQVYCEDSDDCQMKPQGVFIATDLLYELAIPILEVVQDAGSPTRPACYTDTASDASFTITNNGTAPAEDVVIAISSNTQIVGMSYMLSSSEMIPESMPEVTNLASDCNGANVIKSLTDTIKGINLPVGGTITVSYQTINDCDCNICRIDDAYQSRFSILSASDPCSKFYSNIVTINNGEFDAFLSGFPEAPVVLLPGETGTVQYQINSWQYDWLNSSYPNSFFEATVTIECGLDYIPGTISLIDQNGLAYPNCSETYIDKGLGAADSLIIRWCQTDRPPGFVVGGDAELEYDILVDCSEKPLPPCGNLKYTSNFTLQMDIEIDPTCMASCTRQKIWAPEDIDIDFYCPNPGCAPCTGLQITSLTFERKTYGLADNDDNHSPDGTIDLAKIELDRYLAGDTIKATFKGYVSDPNPNVWNYGFATVYLEHSNFTPIGAQVIINDANGPTYTCNAIDIIPDFTAHTITVDFSSASMNGFGCGIPPAYDFDNGDSVQVCLYFQEKDSITDQQQRRVYETDFYISDGDFGLGTAFQCSDRRGRMTQIGISATAAHSDATFGACELSPITIREDRYFGAQGNDEFPFEIRSLGTPKTVSFTKPSEFEYRLDQTQVLLQQIITGTPVTNVVPLTIIPPAYLIQNGDQVTFLAEDYFNSLGNLTIPLDEGYRFYFYPKIQGGCKSIPNISPGYDYSFVVSSSVDQSVFCTSMIMSDTVSDQIGYSEAPELQVIPEETLVRLCSAGDSVVIRVENPTSIPAPNGFIYATSPTGGVIINSIVDLNTNMELTPNPFGIYDIGLVPALATQRYKVLMTANSCKTEQLAFVAGWDCVAVPTTVEEALCSAPSLITFTSASAGMNIDILSPLSDTTVSLCTVTTIEVQVRSTDLGYLRDIFLNTILPPGMEYIPGSFYLSNPGIAQGGSYTSIGDPSPAIGGFSLNVSAQDMQLINIGLVGSKDLSRNTIDIRFDVQTMCSYYSGASIDFIVLGKNNCGDPLRNVTKPSFKLKVTDEEPEFDVNINLDDAVINPCNADSITPVVEMQLVGGIPTNLDSVQFILPPGIKYVPGSYIPISNAIVTPPTEKVVNGLNILVWPFDALIMVGDLIKFSVKLTNEGDQLECTDYELKVQTFASTAEMCGMITCNVGIIAGQGSQKITVVKPELQFVNFDANILMNPSAGTEKASFNAKIINTGTFLLPGNKVAMEIYEDVDRNGVKSTPDILLATLSKVISSVLNPGECISLDSMITYPSGTLCTVIGVLDPQSTCACFEEPSNQVKAGIDIDFTLDTMICSGDVINIGPVAIPNYDFEWLSYNGSPLSLLGSTMTTPTTFSYINMSGSPITYDYVLRSSSTNCYTFDTVSITIAPVIMEVRNVAVCDGRPFDLPAPSYSGTNYMWSPATGLSFNGPDMSTATVIMVSGDTTYTLTYLDETGCMASLVVNLSAQDCGTAQTALGDTVWFDFDRDGIQEAGEPGIEGIQVNLLDMNGNVIRTTYTDANGFYDFVDLIPGKYSVEFVSPPGMIQTTQNAVGNDSLDSDADALGVTQQYFLPINTYNPSIDAGFIPDCSLDLNLMVSECLPTDTGLIRIVKVDLSWSGNVIYQFYDPDTLEVTVLGDLHKIVIDSLEGDTTLTIVTQLVSTLDITASAIFQVLSECSDSKIKLGVEPCLFDLALKKVETSTGPYKYGDMVEMDVIVYNQANQKVTNIVVNDYLPDGMHFINGANPDWAISFGGHLQTVVPGPLCAGESDTIPLIVLLDMGTTDSSWINFAEINSFQDTLGVDMSMFDLDSSPDDTLNNDAGGAPDSSADNYIDGDGTGINGDGMAATDEDDQDPLSIDFFDLALSKQIDTAGTMMAGTDLTSLIYGDVIKFKITLQNQGSLPTDTINVTDYIPAGFDFAVNPGNAGWNMVNSNQYDYYWGGDTLNYLDTTSICIYLTLEPVSATMIGGSTWVNRAEISYAEDLNGVDQSANDADSELNNNPADNVGGQPNSPADDFVNGDGTAAGVNGFASTDQDNEDPAFVAMFDLALTKRVDLTVTPPPYEFGDSIKYVFTITNQGSIPADSIEITDTIPGGLVFLNNPLNAGWDASVANKPVFTINNPLASGADTTICIYLRLQPASGLGAFVNIGEISSAQDTMGMVRTDADSPLNNNFGDNGGGLPNSPADDEIDGDGSATTPDGVAVTDQDNADPAEVQFVDLALLKKIDTLGSITNFATDLSVIQYGDTIKFLMVIENQGTVPMDSLIIADYLPAGFAFVATINNAGWDNSLDPLLNYNWGGDTIFYGERDSIYLDLRLESISLGVTSSAWINRAEIAYAEDIYGLDQSMFDADSPLNNNPADNVGGEPFSGADDYLVGDGSATGVDGVDTTDQDNEDPAGIKLFDLALIKTIDTAGSFNPDDTVRFKITVRNQGCIPSTNITIIDSLPCGFEILSAAMNPGWTAINDSVHLYTIMDTLLPNEVASAFIYVKVAPLISCQPLEARPYDNYAEIFSAQDTMGNNPVDIDSDENSHSPEEDMIFPQKPGDNDILSNSNDSVGSQDDSDFANLIRNDYALIKKLDPSNSGPFAYGDTVKYQIIVQNQGNFFVDSIEVVDYIPDGLTFDTGYGPLGFTNADLGWTGADPQVNYTFKYDVKGNDTLLFLETDTIYLYLSIKPSTMDRAFVNFSEIATIYDTLGVALMADDDSNYGQNGSNAGGAPDTDSDNALFGDGSGMPGDSSATTDADHHDPASLDIVDLALTKSIDLSGTPGPYQYGDSIKYIITVFNQGSVIADSIEITDYIPSGLVFDQALNADWNYDGMTKKAKTLIENADLRMNEDTSVCIYLRLAPADTITAWINQAEISHAVDPDGLVLDSLDKGSIYNDDPLDNGGGAPNTGSDDEILGDGTGMPGDTSAATDQDNADPALTDVLDLALRKVLDSAETNENLVFGDTIKVKIEFYNQGSLPVDSIAITDYLPIGLEFINDVNVNPNWLGTDPVKPVYMWSGDTLYNGDSDTISIRLKFVNPPMAGKESYINYAEISYARDTMGRNTLSGEIVDADSPLNDNPDDNVGSEVETDADDYLLGDGSAMGPDGVDSTDQDNVDGLQLYFIDLALVKKIDLMATPGPYKYNDSVKFNIEVFNFSSVPMDTIVVTDYIPEGFEFDMALNTGWVFNGTDRAKYFISDIINPGEIDTIYIYLRIKPAFNSEAWINEAEISHAVDLGGIVVDTLDLDSPLNDDPTDNGGGSANNPSDDEIMGDGTGIPGDTASATDQDNADVAAVLVFDLALKKQIDSTFTDVVDVNYLDTIKFKIQVFNQGSELALNVELNDYIPDGYTFINGTINPGWTGTGVSPETIVFASIDSLQPQTDTTIYLYTILKPVVAPIVAPYRNYSEILTAMDTSGMVPIDIDSKPDSDSPQERELLPNGPGDDDISSISRDSIGSEDDHDVAGMMIYDLALVKQIDQVNTPGPYRYDDPVKFKIKLINQGGEDVKGIEIVDYIPCGMEYIQTENVGWTLLDDSTAIFMYQDTLVAWGTDSICITLHSFNISEDQSCNVSTGYFNFSEIAAMADINGNPVKDIDSPTDSINDDPGDGPFSDDDDRIDGTGEMGDDEDNHDGAVPEMYDLALIKTTDQVVVNVGDVVLFNIQVINQGNVPATDVSVIDYIPESFDFINNATNQGWMLSGTNAIFESIDSLPVNGDTTLQISLMVNGNLTEYGLVNFAEIEGSFEMDNGSIDADSDPANNPGMFTSDPATNPDANGGNPFDDSDNEIHEEATKMGDSDDHDGAFVVVCQDYACNDAFNASLGYNCEFHLHPSMFFRSFPIPRELVVYTIEDEYRRVFHTDVLGDQFLGQCLKISIKVPICGSNSCWLDVCVDNKYPPLLECTNDTIVCYDPLPGLPDAGPNCSQPYEVEVVFQKWHPFDCDEDDNFEGFYSRTIRATDAWGRFRDCMDTIFIKRINMDSIRCPKNVVIDCCVKGLVPGTTDSVALLWSDYYTDTDANGIPHPKPIVDEHGNSIGLVDPPYIVESGDTSWLLNTKGNCQIVSNYHDHVFPLCGGTFKIKRTWEIQNWCAERDTVCIQWIKVLDTVPPVVDETSIEPITGITNTSTCEAEIEITRPRIKEECGLKFYKGSKGEELVKVHYLIEVPSYDHVSGKEVFYGLLEVGETVILTLPAGNYQIQWTLTDDCWQTAEIFQDIMIIDETGPLAICDFSHVLTLDANECWGRIYAKDLDDGSFDNCCEEIHYAVAKMSDIEMWTNKLRADIIACEGENVYQANRKAFEEQISMLIGCYVFDDYVDVTGCGEEMLVFRAYQACGLPSYDPHKFAGSAHEWYCVNAYTSFAVYWDLFNYKTIEDFSYCASQSFNIAGNMNYDLPVLNPLYTECMSTLHKDDKQAPECIAPADFTVYNDGIPTSGNIEIDGLPFAYTIAATAADVACSNPATSPWDGGVYGYYSGPLDDGLGDSCVYDPMGSYTQPPVNCRFWLLMDRLDALVTPEINFGEPIINDVCTAPEGLDVQLVDSASLDDCGAGTITRTWTISDRCGNTATCRQTITVLPRSDFEVMFPPDTTIDCSAAGDLSPEALGEPVIADNEVERTGVSKTDEVVEQGGGCMTIIRTWQVSDWCVFDPNYQGQRVADIIVDDRHRAGDYRPCVLRNLKDDGDGIIRYVQIIKIVDTESPQILCEASPRIFNSLLDTCGPLNVSFLLGSATDNCTPDDEIEYHYLYRDTAMTTFGAHGTGNTFDEDLDPGVYDIYFIADDGCDNRDTCSIQIEVKDGKAPTTICNVEQITAIMQNGQASIDAILFDAGVFDNCTAKDDLIFSFTADGLTPTDTFTCDDIPDGISDTLTLTIYIFDEAGNVGICDNVKLVLQDNGDNCLNIPRSLITVTGSIMTESHEGVEDVLVEMKPYTSEKSDRKGTFDFGQIEMNKSYDLVPYNNEDPLNGVSTLDLVGIQQHIIGIAPLESPYRIIAADVNNSQTVSAIDIVELRKLILGLYDEFPDNTSWRFADAQYKFGYPSRPWNFAELIKLDDNRMHDPSQDFIGIKVGDVNGTVKPNGLLDADIRNSLPEYIWNIKDQGLVRDGIYTIEIKAGSDEDLTGFQTTLELGDLKFLGIEKGVIELTDQHVGLRHVEKGIVTMSWHKQDGLSVQAGEVLFTLKVQAIMDGKLSDRLELSSAVTKSELYNDVLMIHKMKLDFGVEGGQMIVAQNRPNPFIDKTMIRFELPASNEVEILIYNNQGVLMKRHQAFYGQGIHEYEVKAQNLGSSGLYHYEVKTANESVMKKMILLR